MKNSVFTLMVLLVLQGCGVFKQDYSKNNGRHGFWNTEPSFMANLPQGDDEYSQGFRDGCNTGLGNVGEGFLRSHGFSFDAHRGLEEADYYRGYKNGNNYCTYYVNYIVL